MVGHVRLACGEAGDWMGRRWARTEQVGSPESTKHRARQMTELSIADRFPKSRSSLVNSAN